MAVHQLWEKIQNSLWFRPSIWVIGLTLLALFLSVLDRQVVGAEFFGQYAWFFVSGAAGARTMLGAIATAMLTATTVAFSILMVAVVQTANAYSPRILPLYLRDKGNQHVLGILIGTFVYSLIVLRAIDGSGQQEFVPPLATNVGLLLTLLATGAFIYFIHHSVHSISVSNIILMTLNTVENLVDGDIIFPETLGEPWPGTSRPPLPDGSPGLMESTAGGYVDFIDTGKLMRHILKADAVVHLNCAIGQYVYPGGVLAKVWPATALSDELRDYFQDAIHLSKQRSVSEDLLFGVRQISDIAVRALSPGINDPSTAIHCIDALGLIVVKMAQHGPIETVRCDEEGQVRVITSAPVFSEILDVAFSQLRYYGSGDVATTLHLMQTFGEITHIATRSEERAALWEHALTLLQTADRNIHTPADRTRINELFITVAERFGYEGYHYLLELEPEPREISA